MPRPATVVAAHRVVQGISLPAGLTYGHLEVEAPGELFASASRGLVNPIVLSRSVCRFGATFHRSWHHIREAKAAVRVLWLVLHGRLEVTTSRGTYTVKAGECGIINYDEPFRLRTVRGERGTFEYIVAVIPEHLMLSRLPWIADASSALRFSESHRQLITRLMELYFDTGQLSQKTSEALADAFIQAISDGIGESVEPEERPRKVVEKRFADILACIQKQLTSPDLTFGKVAAQCGISQRYLCYILSANNTSFSDLVWSQRLNKARDWLASGALRGYPIHKIACMAGFKSAAHFSRVFKATYGCSPKEYRARCQGGASGSAARAAQHSEATPAMREGSDASPGHCGLDSRPDCM